MKCAGSDAICLAKFANTNAGLNLPRDEVSPEYLVVPVIARRTGFINLVDHRIVLI
jgi:hypothetical protein